VPVTVCWAVKGGSGATVIAAALALGRRTDSLLVDLDGELPALLGVPEPSGQGVADWLASDAPPAALGRLTVDVTRTTRLIPRGTAAIGDDVHRWHDLLGWAAAQGSVVIDSGTGRPPPELLQGEGVRSLLVTRNCYLALRRASTADCRPDGIVLVTEPGRQLRKRDVEHACGAPVVASVTLDPAISRMVDAGLLATRLPRTFAKELRGAA
jgi:hypothetical protein